jgi:hypothetical protein
MSYDIVFLVFFPIQLKATWQAATCTCGQNRMGQRATIRKTGDQAGIGILQRNTSLINRLRTARGLALSRRRMNFRRVAPTGHKEDYCK